MASPVSQSFPFAPAGALAVIRLGGISIWYGVRHSGGCWWLYSKQVGRPWLRRGHLICSDRAAATTRLCEVLEQRSGGRVQYLTNLEPPANLRPYVGAVTAED